MRTKVLETFGGSKRRLALASVDARKEGALVSKFQGSRDDPPIFEPGSSPGTRAGTMLPEATPPERSNPPAIRMNSRSSSPITIGTVPGIFSEMSLGTMSISKSLSKSPHRHLHQCHHHHHRHRQLRDSCRSRLAPRATTVPKTIPQPGGQVWQLDISCDGSTLHF